MNGYFIAFEGIDGSGKTTLAGLFAEWLRAEYRLDVVSTREPENKLPVCSELYEILKHKDITPWTEFLVFLASRMQHINKIIKPALEEGRIVICDRYVFSTLTYQPATNGCELDKDKVMTVANIFCPIWPNKNILIDIPLELSKKRIDVVRGNGRHRIEEQGDAFFEAVINGYKEYSARSDFITIDGSGTIEEVFELLKAEALKQIIPAIEKKGLIK